MKLFLGTLFVFAPVSLALKAPKNIDGFRRIGKVLANASNMALVDEAIQNAPKFLEDAIAFEQFMNGSHEIADALQKGTSTPKHTSSFLELEGKIESVMERSHALAEIKDIIRFASKRLHAPPSLGIDSINIGLARSGAPWYSLMKSLTGDERNFDFFDSSDVKLIGDVAFFLNIGYKGRISGKWRVCMAAGLYASVFFRGKFYRGDGFKGSEFGGEDFYLGFANSNNVPGYSWSMAFNHDYVKRYARLYADGREHLIKQYKYGSIDHQFHHLSRLSGGFEFTTARPLKDFVAINFGYCVMGRSQGGQCIDVLESKQKAQAQADMAKDFAENLQESLSFLAKAKKITDRPNDSHLKAMRGTSSGASVGDGLPELADELENMVKEANKQIGGVSGKTVFFESIESIRPLKDGAKPPKDRWEGLEKIFKNIMNYLPESMKDRVEKFSLDLYNAEPKARPRLQTGVAAEVDEFSSESVPQDRETTIPTEDLEKEVAGKIVEILEGQLARAESAEKIGDGDEDIQSMKENIEFMKDKIEETNRRKRGEFGAPEFDKIWNAIQNKFPGIGPLQGVLIMEEELAQVARQKLAQLKEDLTNAVCDKIWNQITDLQGKMLIEEEEARIRELRNTLTMTGEDGGDPQQVMEVAKRKLERMETDLHLAYRKDRIKMHLNSVKREGVSFWFLKDILDEVTDVHELTDLKHRVKEALGEEDELFMDTDPLEKDPWEIDPQRITSEENSEGSNTDDRTASEENSDEKRADGEGSNTDDRTVSEENSDEGRADGEGSNTNDRTELNSDEGRAAGKVSNTDDRIPSEENSDKERAAGNGSETDHVKNLDDKEGEDMDFESMEEINNAEKWSKNTVQTGVGHCWCGTTSANAGWKESWDWGRF